MEHIQTIETRNLCDSAKNGGCGECQTSCQSACKTSCGIANQKCESAWNSISPFVMTLAHGGGDFYDGWMKNPKSAMISCNDGFRPDLTMGSRMGRIS